MLSLAIHCIFCSEMLFDKYWSIFFRMARQITIKTAFLNWMILLCVCACGQAAGPKCVHVCTKLREWVSERAGGRAGGRERERERERESMKFKMIVINSQCTDCLDSGTLWSGCWTRSRIAAQIRGLYMAMSSYVISDVWHFMKPESSS